MALSLSIATIPPRVRRFPVVRLLEAPSPFNKVTVSARTVPSDVPVLGGPASPVGGPPAGGGVPPTVAKHFLFKTFLKAAFIQAVSSAYPTATMPPEVFDGIKFDVPRHKDHGEFAIATFQLSKTLKHPPQMIAEALKATLDKMGDVTHYFDVSVAGPYINFKFTNSFLLTGVSAIDANFGQNETMTGKTVLLEFVSANPTGPLHIGHGRWAVLGDSICRLLRSCGAAVTSEFYINDTGAQIDRFTASVTAVKEGKPVPEDGYHGEYIRDLASQEGDPVTRMIEHQRRTLKALGVTFDRWFSEKTLHEQGKLEEAIKILEDSGLTYRATAQAEAEDEPNAAPETSEGEALWFRSTKFGDDKDRVLVRADGRPTYFAADVAYHLDKIRRGYGLLINIFGADHHGYVARISAAIQALSGQAQKHEVIIGQLVKLLRGTKEVKMSKRAGTAIMLHDLNDEIGPDAVRVFMGSTGFDTAVNIDLDVAVSQSEANPVFYIQYAYARISHVIKRGREKGLEAAMVLPADYLLNDSERTLIAQLFQFPDQVLSAAERRRVDNVLKYAVDLAQTFHSFYQNAQVIDESSPEVSQIRLAMITAAKQTFKNCFDLLGISAPEEMKRKDETT